VTIEGFGYVLLPSTDVDRDVRFYQDTLGMPLLFQDGQKFASLRCGTTRLALAGQSEQAGTTGTIPTIKFSNLADLAGRLRSHGHTVGEIVEGGHERTLRLQDPSGNGLLLYESTRPTAPSPPPEPAAPTPTTVDLDTFRRVMGSFPSGVAVITTVDGEGKPRGLTSLSVCSVSAEPPLLLVCVSKTSRTLPALRASRSFVVNILKADRGDLSAHFASRAVDKFAGLTWAPASAAGGAPILTTDVTAWAACQAIQEVEAGDHWVIIGSIVAAAANEATAALLYCRRQYANWRADEASVQG
jgi:flavin reductase (DIM6/NTAB) family NADH-FMN oxidoreductase RutF